MSGGAPKPICFAEFSLDLARCSLRRGDATIPLRPKSFDVLRYLAENPGRLVAKDELMNVAWPGIFVTDDSLVQCIKDIREALDDAEHRIIKTVPRRGYLFAATITSPDSPPEPQAIAQASSQLGPFDWRHASIAGVWLTGLLIIVGLALAHLLIQPANTPDPPATADNHRPKAIPLVTARSLPIAVLPLVSHGDATDSEYFADGLTEDIISALGRFSELSVRSRGAVLPYKGKTPSPAQVGRELGVRYVLEGSIRRNGDRIRVSVQLADIEHAASVLWSEHFDASLQDIFAVQDEITRRIAGSLAVRLGGLELARMATKPPSRLEAYDFVLRGRDFLARTTRTANAQARALFERAISLDPHYVPALVGLGLVDVNAVRFGWTADPDEALERAERLGRKALAIDEATPSAHALLGRIHIRRGDLERALDAMRRALALNPSDADSYAGLGNALLLLGDVDGAIAAIETAAQLHPQMPVTDHFRLSMAYILAERSAEAIRTLEHALERNDGNVFLAAMLAAAYAAAGRQEDAARQSLAVRRLSPLFASDEIGSLFRNPAHREKIRAALRKAGL